MIKFEDVFKEIKSPQEVEAMEEPNTLGLIYKAVYMVIRLLLDIRLNQVLIGKKLGISLKSDKPVTKE